MQDYILAGLVFLLFVVFLFKTQSFADMMSPGNCFKNSLGPVQFIDDPSGDNNALCKKQSPNYPNAKPGDSGKHYCCQ